MTESTRYGQADDVEREKPEADALEQDLDPTADLDGPSEGEVEGFAAVRETPLEANPADAADQNRSAGGDDDDDYR